MAANLETTIWLAIKSRIDTLLPAYSKAWPSQIFTPPSNSTERLPYLRIGRVTATPARQFIADSKAYERTGFIIITLVYPLGQSQSAYDQLAGSIADHFNDSVKMRSGGICVSIPSYPQIVEGYEDDGYWNIPVRVPWRTFA